jgi:hypothetical protein
MNLSLECEQEADGRCAPRTLTVRTHADLVPNYAFEGTLWTSRGVSAVVSCAGPVNLVVRPRSVSS